MPSCGGISLVPLAVRPYRPMPARLVLSFQDQDNWFDVERKRPIAEVAWENLNFYWPHNCQWLTATMGIGEVPDAHSAWLRMQRNTHHLDLRRMTGPTG